MEITKEKLFAMYLANENQKVLYRNEVICDLEEVSKWDDTCNIVNPEGNFLDCCNISDCQLILKPVSEMSRKDESKYNKQRDIIDLYYYEDYGGSRRDCKSMHDTINSTLWLIQNGYALSDKYFEKKWAVKERDVK